MSSNLPPGVTGGEDQVAGGPERSLKKRPGHGWRAGPGWKRVAFNVPPEFVELCKSRELSPTEALKGFIADLCEISIYVSDAKEPHNARLLREGYQSNGSDERMMANAYFDRAHFPPDKFAPDGGEDRTPLDDLIPHKDRNQEDKDLCSACGKDVSPAAGVDNYSVFYTPAKDDDGIYILAWCSRECIFEWARQLLEKFVGVKRADLLSRASNPTGETCAHGVTVTRAPAGGAYCPCCQVRASDDQNPVECALCVTEEYGEVGT